MCLSKPMLKNDNFFSLSFLISGCAGRYHMDGRVTAVFAGIGGVPRLPTDYSSVRSSPHLPAASATLSLLPQTEGVEHHTRGHRQHHVHRIRRLRGIVAQLPTRLDDCDATSGRIATNSCAHSALGSVQFITSVYRCRCFSSCEESTEKVLF